MDKIMLSHIRATIPVRQSEGAAGLDLSCVEDVVLEPNKPTVVQTGISIQLSNPNEHIQIVSRSGLSRRGIVALNSPGIVDSDFRGELKVILMNFSTDTITLIAGSRIAQLLIMTSRPATFKRVDALDCTTRGENGLGSTGI